MDKHVTEAVYDEQLAPLVTQIIEICKEHNLPLLLNVGMMLPKDEPACEGDGLEAGGCGTLILCAKADLPDARLQGMRNRMALANELLRASNPRLDYAAALQVSRFHPDTPAEAINSGIVALTIVSEEG